MDKTCKDCHCSIPDESQSFMFEHQEETYCAATFFRTCIEHSRQRIIEILAKYPDIISKDDLGVVVDWDLLNRLIRMHSIQNYLSLLELLGRLNVISLFPTNNFGIFKVDLRATQIGPSNNTFTYFFTTRRHAESYARASEILKCTSRNWSIWKISEVILGSAALQPR